MTAAVAKPGMKLPEAPVWEGSPDNCFKITDLFKGKKGVLVGSTGAFTPTCTKEHIPEYIEKADQFKSKGVDVIAVLTANDPFVNQAWAEQLGGPQKGVHFLSDVHLELTQALGLEATEMAEKLGKGRVKRYAAVVEDNEFKVVNVEDGSHNSYASKILEQL